MTDINITYYFGQIKPEYRGKLALLIDTAGSKPGFTALPLNSSKLMQYTEKLHPTIRSYLGVNQKAQPALIAKLRKGVGNAFDLDKIIIADSARERKLREISHIADSSLNMAIAMGK